MPSPVTDPSVHPPQVPSTTSGVALRTTPEPHLLAALWRWADRDPDATTAALAGSTPATAAS